MSEASESTDESVGNGILSAGTSQRKIVANRQNAQRSTGPRTPQGKAKVRSNAVTHGLTANEVAASMARLGENPEEFECLLGELMAESEPVGVAERFLVEEIAKDMWRARRSARAEGAELYRHRRSAENDAQRAHVTSIDEDLHVLIIPAMRAELAETNIVSDKTLQRLESLSSAELMDPASIFDGSRVRLLLEQAQQVRHQAARVTTATDPADKKVEALSATIAALRAKLDDLDISIDVKLRAGNAARELAREVTAIPGADAMERLMRYETTNSRQLDRALNQLRQLQRDRQKRTVGSTSSRRSTGEH